MISIRYILPVLLLSCLTASAQVSNRHKVIQLILSEHKLKPHNTHPEVLASQPSSMMLTPEQSTIPKYSLPKGNVFCRMEDYVQMHTPLKLNIGVGGQ